MKLERWSKMRDKSRVIPTPGKLSVGDIVGGDVYGSPKRPDGTTITTGDIVEIRDGAVVTKSNGGTEVYELGESLWAFLKREAKPGADEDSYLKALMKLRDMP